MGGGILQLVYYGAEDLFLTGNPSISFYRAVYRRYCPFGMEYIPLYFDTIPSFTPIQETKTTCKIDRNADLVYDMYLVYDLPALFTNNQIPVGWAEEVGTKIIKEISIRADGTLLDTQRGEFLKVYTDLTLPIDKKAKFLSLVGGESFMLNSGQNLVDNIDKQQIAIQSKRLYIPLYFWFCRNSGLALPLIATQYNQIFIDITFNPLNEIIRIGNPLVSPKRLFGDYQNSDQNVAIRNYLLYGNIEGINTRGVIYDQNNAFYYFTQNNWQSNTYLLANYIYLGDDERTRFAQTTLEYLIPQVQYYLFTGLKQGPNTLELTLNHPVSELIWYLTRDDLDLTNDWYNFSGYVNPDSFQWIQNQYGNYNFDFSTNPTTSTNQIPNLEYINTLTNYVNGVKQQSVDKIANINLQTYFGNYYRIMSSMRPIFNNHDRMAEQQDSFYQNLQVYKYHTGRGHLGLYCLSFALEPESPIQPSGSTNFSRLDSQELYVVVDQTYPIDQVFNFYLYAINWQVLRFMGGIVAPVFAN